MLHKVIIYCSHVAMPIYGKWHLSSSTATMIIVADEQYDEYNDQDK